MEQRKRKGLVHQQNCKEKASKITSFFFFSFNLLNRESVKFLAMSKSMRFKIDFFGPFEIYFAFGCRDKKRAKEIFFSQFSVCERLKFLSSRL